jgi:hypothetical protein
MIAPYLIFAPLERFWKLRQPESKTNLFELRPVQRDSLHLLQTLLGYHYFHQALCLNCFYIFNVLDHFLVEQFLLAGILL